MDTIITERLILRPWSLDDSKDLFEYGKSELVGPNAGWKPHKDEEESKLIIEMFLNENDSWAIVLKSENKVIGSVGLHNRKPNDEVPDIPQRELGYVLNPSYWGHGYIPEASKAAMDYGFNNMNLQKIWCGHFDYNNKSKRVIEKLSMKYEFTGNKVLTLLDNNVVSILYYSKDKE